MEEKWSLGTANVAFNISDILSISHRTKLVIQWQLFFISSKSYGKCSRIMNTFLFLFSKCWFHKTLVRIATRADPDQTVLIWVFTVCLGLLAGNWC